MPTDGPASADATRTDPAGPRRRRLNRIIAVGSLGVALLSVVVMGLSAMQRETQLLIDQAGTRLLNQSTAVARALDGVLDDRLRLMALLAAQIGDEGRLETQRRDATSALRAELDRMVEWFEGLVWLGVADANGRVIVASGGLLEGTSIADRSVFIGSRRGPFFGDRHPAVRLQPLLRPQDPRWEVLDVGAPFFDAAQRLSGVVVAHLDWHWLIATHRDAFAARRLDAGGHSWLIDAEGVLISEPDGSLPVGSSRSLPASTLDAIRSLEQAGGGWTRVTWVDGRDVFVGVSGDPVGLKQSHFSWTSVVTEDAAVTLAPVRDVVTWMALIAALALALAFVSGLWMAGKIAAPIQRLANATHELRRGRIAQIPFVDDYREVADLSAALRGLLESLVVVRTDLDAERSRAMQDPLTGLLNRHALDDVMTQTGRAAAQRGDALALIYLDLDGFKPINDRYGHAVGDSVLRFVATRLQRALRADDHAFRLGGDEFLALIRIAQHDVEATAVRAAERLIRVMAAPMSLEALSEAARSRSSVAVEVEPLGAAPPSAGDGPVLVRVGATAGVGVWRPASEDAWGSGPREAPAASDDADGGTWRDVMTRADEALIAGKQIGKGAVYLASAVLVATAGRPARPSNGDALAAALGQT